MKNKHTLKILSNLQLLVNRFYLKHQDKLQCTLNTIVVATHSTFPFVSLIYIKVDR